jgi:hypothetical protein
VSKGAVTASQEMEVIAVSPTVKDRAARQDGLTQAMWPPWDLNTLGQGAWSGSYGPSGRLGCARFGATGLHRLDRRKA